MIHPRRFSRTSHQQEFRRKLFLESLEDRRLLTAAMLPGAEQLGPWLPTDLIAPPAVSYADSNVGLEKDVQPELPLFVSYGPLLPEQQFARGDGTLTGGRDKQVDTLYAPVMELTGLSDDIAAAVTAAWEIPVDSITSSWVVGLEIGTAPADLSALNFVSSTNALYLPNAYVLEWTASASVIDMGEQIGGLEAVDFYYPLIAEQHVSRAVPNDPLFPEQWHLQNTGQSGGTVGADANVVDAWDTYDGTGVVIAIVDDGLQHAHPDLTGNYDAALSHDFNGNDADPTPNAGDDHGTACAGVAAAEGNNGLGVSGAAPDATLAGLRLTAAGTTDLQDATALSYLRNSIDIYNSSWGPADNGTVQGAGPQTLAAFADSVLHGRDGLGNIYVWAAGNGLGNNDNVNYDGYANSRYVIAVSAVDHKGDQSWYSEPGAPILVTAYSNGDTAGITTTTITGTGDLQDPAGSYDYTSSFGGTSSAAPLVSGVTGLILEANPNLTWRDVQHVLVNSAKRNDPSDSDWIVNGAGRYVNHKYGFGAIDAEAAVNLAATWTNVAPEINATSGTKTVNLAIPDNNPTGVSSTIVMTDDIKIETVEIVFNATHTYRGDLEVVLISPSGTRSVLAQKRADAGDNYNNWVFSSKRHWGESSAGTWTLQVSDLSSPDAGTFNSWKLNFYGTPAGSDYGDAPDDPYGTLQASNGAEHRLGGPRLGTEADADNDGQPTSDASGDGADDDGVMFIDPPVVGTTTNVQITSTTGGARLNYFVDFDHAGGFGNVLNESFSASLAGNVETVGLTVPAGAQVGATFARFRISSTGGLGPLGYSDDGEVEDYALTVFAASPDRDFGDAPIGFGTTRAEAGASHILGGPQLGLHADSETDGKASASANGDGNDDDGVHFKNLFVPNTLVEIDVHSSSGGGELDYFIDFDGDGVFGNTPQEVFHATLAGGDETVSVRVPADAMTGTTFARFRISSAGHLGPLGMGWDGEVEDYQIQILPPTNLEYYPLQSFDAVTAPALPQGWTTESEESVLWKTVTTTSNTAPNSAYVGNVKYVSQSVLASPLVSIVNANAQLHFRNRYNMEYAYDGGVLEISIDGGQRMDILDAGGLFQTGGYDRRLSGGWGNPLGGRLAWTGDSGQFVETIVSLPASAVGKSVQFFWVAGTDQSRMSDGWYVDTIQLAGMAPYASDFGDAPDPTYPTLSASGGAAHVVVGGLFLGSLIDVDSSGQPDATANGDDNGGVDDEDGVIFTSQLEPGTSATVEVVASGAGVLNAWIDFNADGDWSDSGEQVFHDVSVDAGLNQLSFPVPVIAKGGLTYSRFRLSSQAGILSDGLAPDGEVEDYQVEVQDRVAVLKRSLFYNNSVWDGNSGAANAADDQAIATDKQALLPGQLASFANYSTYSRGINGIMLDIANLADPAGLSASDFEFRVGNSPDPGAWPLLSLDPSQITIAVRSGMGVSGSDRVTIVFPDHAIQNTWLQVTVKATGVTGLGSPQVHYWGHATGETGDVAGDSLVDEYDLAGVLANPLTAGDPAAIDDIYDFNRDQLVDALDQALAVASVTNPNTALHMLDLRAAGLPQISLSLSPSAVAEDGTENLVYTFTRGGDVSAPLTVNFRVTGNALFGDDYSAAGADTLDGKVGTVMFAAGSATAEVVIDPTADEIVELDETAWLVVLPSATNAVATAAHATGTISADDTLQVSQTVIQDGNDQRSIITHLRVSFNAEVAIAADAFQLVNRNTQEVVTTSLTTSLVDGKTEVTLTFLNGASVYERKHDYGLVDGNYELTIFAAKVTYQSLQLDGDRNGTAGDDFLFGSSIVDHFFRFYGDVDGDRDVDAADYSLFSPSYRTRAGQAGFNPYFDSDGDADVDASDYAQFSPRYRKRLAFF